MTDFEKSFQGTICRLLVYSPFSFNLLVGMNTVATDSVETMGVCVKNGRISLRYNPQFFVSLEEGERTYVLIHEMMHVLLHHCTHRSSSDRRRAYKENVAMDLAINSLIYEETGIKIPRFKEDVGNCRKGDVMSLLPMMFGYKNCLSFEQYLTLLDQDFPDVSVQFVGGDGEIDENCPLGEITRWRLDNRHGEGFEEDAYIDDYVRNVVENIGRNHGWGHLDGTGIEMVMKAQEQPLNWGDILRLKLGPFLSYQKEQSRRRWNKHYGKPFLGYTTKCVEPVAVYADTSGSVGTQDLSRFIVEIERIANYTGVYLWSFDTAVQDPDETVLFNRRSIAQIEFKGRGGTSFTPIFEHAQERHFSQVVILTDGVAEKVDPDLAKGMDVVWVITKDGDTDNKPGTVIKMDR